MNIAIVNNRQARVAYDDLRELIIESDKLGELVRANGYSWQEDIGMAAELLQHNIKAPVAARKTKEMFSWMLKGVPEQTNSR